MEILEKHLDTKTISFEEGRLITKAELPIFLNNTLQFFCNRDMRFAALLSKHPDVLDVLNDSLLKVIDKNKLDGLIDYEIMYNMQFWLHHYNDFGLKVKVKWDSTENILYPLNYNAIAIRGVLNLIKTCIKNVDELTDKFIEIMPDILETLETHSLRVLCNHATWLSNGAIIYLLHRAKQKYILGNRFNDFRVDRKFLKRNHLLLGPFITSLAEPMINVKLFPLSPFYAATMMSNLVKTVPNTLNARLDEIPNTRKRLTERALAELKRIEDTPGNILYEAPSGTSDYQKDGQLYLGPVSERAVRLDSSSKLLLVGLDERDCFQNGHMEDGQFFRGRIRPGNINLNIDPTYLKETPPKSHHIVMEKIMACVKDERGQYGHYLKDKQS